VNTDKYLYRTYHKDLYNCAHFVCEIWKDLVGEDISAYLQTLLKPKDERHIQLSMFRKFTRLDRPISPCIVYMLCMKEDPHVGVYVNGMVLNLRRQGPEYLPLDLAGRGFNSMRFYR
jgi:ABC-type enterochelin transport system permease subunit